MPEPRCSPLEKHPGPAFGFARSTNSGSESESPGILTHYSRIVCGALSLAMVAVFSIECEGRFVGRILAHETGLPLAASVRVKDAEGERVEIEGDHAHVYYLQQQWCYVDGEFVLSQPDRDGWEVQIRRGLETFPLEADMANADEQEFRLRRWTDMADAGYMSGDTHVHFLELDQCHLQMRAEDLGVLNLLTSDFTHDVSKFSGELASVSSPGHWVYVGQEFRDWQQGHINLLRLREIVQPYEPFGGIFRENAYRHLLVSPAAREARAQGAAVTWAHFGDIPGAESPIAIAHGLIDAVDLITQGDPTKPPLHWEPWRMERPGNLPVLSVLPGIELYYQYLNSGFQLPLAAGTDKMSDRIPVGSSRLYVWTGEDRSFDAWIRGLKAGNGFISNGPLLTFSVGEHRSGEVIDFDESRTLVARCTARSIHKFSRLQIMVNGQAVAIQGPPRKDESGIYQSEIEFPIALDRSVWIAARVAAAPGEGDAVMPRRMKVFAHANPIYFLRRGAKVRVQDSIDYLSLYLRYTEHWFRTAANFETDAHRQEALREVGRAMGFFGEL